MDRRTLLQWTIAAFAGVSGCVSLDSGPETDLIVANNSERDLSPQVALVSEAGVERTLNRQVAHGTSERRAIPETITEIVVYAEGESYRKRLRFQPPCRTDQNRTYIFTFLSDEVRLTRSCSLQ